MSVAHHPILTLTLASALALLAYALAAWRGRGAQAMPWLGLGWAAQAVALLVDIGGLGDGAAGARFGVGPALSLTVWLVMAVALLEGRMLPLEALRRPLALLAAAAVALAWALPGQSHQASSPWAPLHWALGLASYGLVGAAVLHAWLMQRAEAHLRSARPAVGPGLPLLRLERLTFQYVAGSVVVLGAALALGAWFSPRWQWDHKTVFALLSWGVLAALWLGRWRLGWRGRQAARWVYLGSALLLLSYAGSRFVLQVLLGRSV